MQSRVVLTKKENLRQSIFIDTGDIVAYRLCRLRFDRGFKVK